ncbi:MAG: hypothetical protein Q4F95_07410 [Oscillospiraceae bacterium]|nr:hypothetical protein [Oscillospiraceae bacterium]
MKKESKQYLEITLKNMKKCQWEAGKEFTDFNYDGKCLIIKKDDRLVGLYPVDALMSVVFFD